MARWERLYDDRLGFYIAVDDKLEELEAWLTKQKSWFFADKITCRWLDIIGGGEGGDHGLLGGLGDDDHPQYVFTAPTTSTRNVIEPTSVAVEPLSIRGLADIGAVTFTGTGLDDLTVSGFESSGGDVDYMVEIDATGTPDTHQYSIDGGSTWKGTGVECLTYETRLDNNVNITFASGTGHTVGDRWEFSTVAQTANHLTIESQDEVTMMGVDGDGKLVGFGGAPLFHRVGIGNRFNIGIGTNCPASLVAGTLSGIRNFLFGPGAGPAITTGYGNILMGFNAGNTITTGYQNTAIGTQALASGTTCSFNFALGNIAGSDLTTGSSNVAIGASALRGVTTGERNVAIGQAAMESSGTDADRNVAIGFAAGHNLEGNQNICIGYYAAYAQTTSTNSVAIGREAIRYNVTGSSNVAVGYRAGYGASGQSHGQNIFIGASAGLDVTTGSNNVIIGHQTGDGLTSGTGNVVLGYRVARTTLTTGSNQLWIHNLDTATPLIYGEFDGAGGVGVKIHSPATTAIALVIKAIASQSANLQEWQDSNAAILSHINADGSFHIGDATNYCEIKADGDILLHGTACVWKHDDLVPANIGKPSTNPPGVGEYQGFAFDRYHRSTEEQVYYLWHIPPDFATGDASVRGHYGFFVENPPSGTGNENVRMGFEYKKISPTETFDFSSGTASGYLDTTITDGEAAYYWHETGTGVCTTTGFAVGDLILFRFYRDATAGADTYENEAAADDNDVWVGTYHLEYLSCRIGGDT